MKYNLNLIAIIAISIGVTFLYSRRKNENIQTYFGYAFIIGGFSWFAYSSKALLLLMYQKFIQEEVNIQIQQQTKQIQKNQSKKKQQIKNENLIKTPIQQQSTTQDSEISQQQQDNQVQKEIKKETQKLVNQDKQTKSKQEDQKVKNINNTQIQSELQLKQTQVKKENKQKIKQPLLQQQVDNDNDEEWVEVGNKKKQLNRPQKKEEEIQIQQQNQQPQKNQQQQNKPLIQTNKQDPPKVEIIESNKTQSRKEKKQKQKKEEPIQEEDDDEWISVEIKQTKKKDKSDIDIEQTNNNQQKSRGLFTKEEYQKLKDEAKQIEDAYKQRIQQIDDIHHFKSISKLTQYEVKNADQILNNQNVVYIPKIDLKMPDVQPKNYTREEIDKLVQSKMPKLKNVVSNDVFIEKSEPIQIQPKKNIQTDIKVLKSKFTLFKSVQLEQEQKQKEQIIYTDPSISFITNKDKQRSFFPGQIELTTNTTGKELFGRVKRYRRPIQMKNKSDTKQNKNVVSDQQFITDDNESVLQNQGKLILPGYQTLDQEGRNKLIRDSVSVLYRQDQKNQNILEEETIRLIQGGCKEIIQQDYIQLINRFRELRRKSLQERKYEEYINLIKQMDKDIYQLSQNGIHIIIQCLNIKEEDYQKAFQFYSQQSKFVSSYFQENLKDVMPIKFKLNKQQGIELIKYKIDVVEHYESNQQFSSVMKLFHSQQESKNSRLMKILLNSLIEDIIYQKHGYEEEDKRRFMKLFKKDQEIRELQLKFEHLVENLQGVKTI